MAQRIDYDSMLRLRSEGLSASQIAARLGCSPASVHAAAKKFGLERRPSGPTPQLSDAEITQLWHDGVRMQDIADRCGVSTTTIYVYAKRLRLPKRPRASRPTIDPSPAEIERLKLELRERHLQERMREDVTNTQSKVSKWRNGICNPRGVA
jgi:DNA-binding CsgD family transcriptional regulator